ncbi:MAG: Hpt domain-containing protein [Chitinispirillia bacterium]|jgi:HPt (histidine-containing phosphotransfer) domain-containing protein
MTEEKILDLETALTDMAGDREIYEEVVAVFLNDTPNTLLDISSAYNSSDIPTLNRLAHSIKSASRSIGGLRLGSVAEKLENDSAIDNLSDVESSIQELNSEFKNLKQKLAEEGFFAQLTG